MKVIKIALRTCPKFLHWLVISSLVVLIIKFFWLDDIPAFFPKAQELGNLMSDLLMANIAGYIFYFISSEIPKAIEKRFNGEKIMDIAEIAANGVTGFLQMAYYTNKEHHPELENILNKDSVTEDIVRREFSLIDPNSTAPMRDGMLGVSLTWLGAMVKQDASTKNYISKLWRLSPFIEAELCGLLLEIEELRHSAGMENIRDLQKPGRELPITNKDLTAWAANYYECYDIARRIFTYCAAYRKKYEIKSIF